MANIYFNKLFANVEYRFEEMNDVIDLLKLYFLITFYSNDVIIIESYEDIQENGADYCIDDRETKSSMEKEEKEIVNIIKPPDISITDDYVKAKLFTWSADRGLLSYWEITIYHGKTIRIDIQKHKYHKRIVGCPKYKTLL